MKRVDLVRHLVSQGCFLLRNHGKHTVDCNPTKNQTSTVPRHTEVNDFLARNLGIREP